MYLYSKKINGQALINTPIDVIECFNINDRNNKFILISKELSDKNIIKNPLAYFKKIKLSCHLINANNNIITSTNERITSLNLHQFNLQKQILMNMNSNTVAIPNKNCINFKQKNIFEISDRLKVLLLLAISQRYVPCNNLEKIYLINPQWVEQYNYKEINLLVNKRKNELINNWNKSYDLNSLSTVIPLLNIEQLKKLEQNINSNNNIPFEASFEQIELQDKYFDIYKEFIIVNNHLFTLLQKYFQITPSGEQIFYIHKKGEGDLLIISNHQVYNQIKQVNAQNSILAGIMNRDETKFDIKHILDYKDYNILNKEINILLKYNFIS